MVSGWVESELHVDPADGRYQLQFRAHVIDEDIAHSTALAEQLGPEAHLPYTDVLVGRQGVGGPGILNDLLDFGFSDVGFWPILLKNSNFAEFWTFPRKHIIKNNNLPQPCLTNLIEFARELSFSTQ